MGDDLNQRYENAVAAIRDGKYREVEPVLAGLVASAALDFQRREHSRMLLGFARAQIDDWAGAITCFKEVLINDIECLPAQTALGHAYLMNGNVQEALETFRVAVQRDARNPQARHGLGWTLLEEGSDLDEALYQLQEALRLDPDSAAVRDSVGWALYRLGDLEGSLEQLEEAVKRNPDHPIILQHRREVRDALARRASHQEQNERRTS